MRQLLGRVALLLCAASLAAPDAGHAAPSLVDPSLGVRTAASGLTQPTGIAFLGPNDMLVLEKNTGLVKRVVDGTVTGAVLDLAVNSASERGLLGIALHPDFAANPFVYLYWTSSTTAADTNVLGEVPLLGNRVDRFVWNGSTLAFDRNIIQFRARQIDAMQPERGNHNGGVLRFGPDGKLYVLVGDVGRRGQLQNLTNGPFGPGMPDDTFGGPEPDNAHTTGAILRLNDDGSSPSDNPFFSTGAAFGGQVGANVQRLFAYGIRNSFGMAFEPCSGDVWVQENGDDSFDELNRVEPGFNSGWVQIMGPPERIAEYRAIETDPTAPQPFAPGGYFGLQQIRWPPTNIATTEDEALSRLFSLPGSHYSAPEFSWKFNVSPGGLGFLNTEALGEGYGNDLFVGAAREVLEGGQLFRFNLTGEGGVPTGFQLDDPRLADLVADNVGKFDITESESLLFGRGFGITTDIQTGPNGNLFVVSLTEGAVYEIFNAAQAGPNAPSDECPPDAQGAGPALTLDLVAKKQELKKRLKLFATASGDSMMVAEGKAIKDTTKALATNQTTKFKAKLKRRQAEKLERKLERKGKAKTKVEATASDQDGATAADKVKVKLKD
jgi:aldose sugar dehydrogenase